MLTKGEDMALNIPPVVPVLVGLKILVEKAGGLVCWLNEGVNGCCPVVEED
jgi:hypothetical protein